VIKRKEERKVHSTVRSTQRKKRKRRFAVGLKTYLAGRKKSLRTRRRFDEIERKSPGVEPNRDEKKEKKISPPPEQRRKEKGTAFLQNDPGEGGGRDDIRFVELFLSHSEGKKKKKRGERSFQQEPDQPK